MKLYKLLVIAALAGPLATYANAQNCQSCGPTSGMHSQNCGSGYGSCGHNGCSCLSDEIEAQRERFELVTARNYAWPKPFDCQSRQSYMAIWQPGFDAGWQVEHTLSDIHFDEKTNELSKVGKARVAGIMRNAPSHRRTIFIYQGAGELVTDERIQKTRDAIAEWWGFVETPQIFASTYNPEGMSGSHVYPVNDLFTKGIQPPKLSEASSSTTSSGGN